MKVQIYQIRDIKSYMHKYLMRNFVLRLCLLQNIECKDATGAGIVMSVLDEME